MKLPKIPGGVGLAIDVLSIVLTIAGVIVDHAKTREDVREIVEDEYGMRRKEEGEYKEPGK